MSRLLTTAEAATRLGVSPRQVARLVARGELVSAQKLPGTYGAYLFRAEDLTAWRKSRAA